jgi:hypothetical protein
MSYRSFVGTIDQTYDEWLTLLCACAVACDRLRLDLTREQQAKAALALLNEDEPHPDQEDEARFKRVSAALGLHVRVKATWKVEPWMTTRTCWVGRVDGEEVAVLTPHGVGEHPMWRGVWFNPEADFPPLITVRSHPTPQSAIEHLERLRGKLQVLEASQR